MKELMAKAMRAVNSAKLLLDANDFDGACNRAYYAMFDAARAALFASNTEVQPDDVRTHSGLISAFSLHLVKPGHIPIEIGRALNKVQELRLIADYRGDSVDADKAAWAVEQAMVFVSFMQKFIAPPPPKSSPTP